MTAFIPVLLYHSVSAHSSADDSWAVSRADFNSHVDAIAASGRVGVGITALAAALRGEQPLPDRPVAVTFDDGFADTYDAVDALHRRGLPSTVYVTTGDVGAPDRLSTSCLVRLANVPGVELGAHAVRHRRMDELDDRELAEEVRVSKAQLEEMTGDAVHSFAYPHGAYDRRVRQAVIDAGYQAAAAVKNAVSHPEDDPFAIARWTVVAGTSAVRIEQVLEGERVPRAWAGERLRTRASRTARRHRRRVFKTIGLPC